MSLLQEATQDYSLNSDTRNLSDRFVAIRNATVGLCEHLEPEDFVVQSMEDASPAKWHLAHTTWFFETFVLSEADPMYKPFHPKFAYLFNSYYVQAGERWQRPYRGLLSRPTVAEVYDYRNYVDRAMGLLLSGGLGLISESAQKRLRIRIEIGLHHEQQHQELLLTDIKHLFSINPLRPAIGLEIKSRAEPEIGNSEVGWVGFDGGVFEVGFTGDGFFYDNEKPRHPEYVPGFELASRTVTCAEYIEFMNDGGYERSELWLSMGWAAMEAGQWKAPFYWEPMDGIDLGKATMVQHWQNYTLHGMRGVAGDEPVTNISFFEADAFARWRGCHLPTEAMWEHACLAANCELDGNFVESGLLHPVAAGMGVGLKQMLGNTWEWTSSPYVAYPGYQAPPGALGEYNGKFMCNQMVLRGGSCATPESHIRPTYRNFFPPGARWQFSGIRLARYHAK